MGEIFLLQAGSAWAERYVLRWMFSRWDAGGRIRGGWGKQVAGEARGVSVRNGGGSVIYTVI